jgi:intergrase/recombinase
MANFSPEMGINGNHITEEVLQEFAMFCKVDLLRSRRTIKEHINNLKRYRKVIGSLIYAANIRDFLFYIRRKYSNPRTYRSYLCTLKVFCRDFLKKGEWVESLRFPKIQPKIITYLPSKQQLRTFFKSLPNDKAKAAFLIYCTSGLRMSEIFNAKILKEIRAIIPTMHEHYSTKNSYVSFYNLEAEKYLKKEKFNIHYSQKSIYRWFKIARQETGIHLTPQILREWFCTEMALLGVADRYVDAFCGRVPKSVLGRRYTNYSIETMKTIYDKAQLRIFS